MSLRHLDDLPPLYDTDSDMGDAADFGLVSEEEVLAPRLIDFEAFRASGEIRTWEGHQPAGEPRKWPLVAGVALLGLGMACGVGALGMGIAGILFLLF